MPADTNETMETFEQMLQRTLHICSTVLRIPGGYSPGPCTPDCPRCGYERILARLRELQEHWGDCIESDELGQVLGQPAEQKRARR